MSMAVCLRCGARKHGALVPCAGCDHVPVTQDDRARHLLAVEGLGPEEVERLSQHIAAGGAPPEPTSDDLDETLALLADATPLKVAGFALLAGGVPFLALLALLLVVAWVVTMV